MERLFSKATFIGRIPNFTNGLVYFLIFVKLYQMFHSCFFPFRFYVDLCQIFLSARFSSVEIKTKIPMCLTAVTLIN